MAYTVTIKYTKPVAPVENPYLQIMSMFEPEGSYVDSAAYTGATGETVWSDKVVGATDITEVRDAAASTKSIYSTNVPGWGSIEVPEFFKDTHIPFPLPLAQFIMNSVVGIDGADPATPGQITFDVDKFEEAAYYTQLGKDMADQGFEITVVKAAEADNGEG